MKILRTKTQFVCQQCGYRAPRWSGRCPDCGEWNSLREEQVREHQGPGRPLASGPEQSRPVPLHAIAGVEDMRFPTGFGELDRVLGGGVVPGSVVLVGGDPGIGKTTLLLQVLAALASGRGTVLYVSGEESGRQIKLRADRLGLTCPTFYLLPTTLLPDVINAAQDIQPIAIVVDSIQTVYTDQISSAPGTVSQIQEVACQLMWLAKRNHMPVFIIGHVTKEGAIAGPRLLEHLVDTVLYFEGDKTHTYRMLRAVKNRFGTTNEIGVFEMKEQGLVEVPNPSALFLAGRPVNSTGSVVVCTLEGTRPILVELQALVTDTAYPMPKRMANGVEVNRVALLLAVMEKRLGMQVAGQDVYVNVVGGLQTNEPALDLGIVLAVASSLRDHPLDPHTMVLGEVGLSGEVRPVHQAEQRVREAEKLGFRRCILPAANVGSWGSNPGVELMGIHDLHDAVSVGLGS
ncbi:MAG: DNA repair protein RadA [Nitrospirae bacterium]|nr:MAG: DNA repair protein RadA [Nitrospirota bacterium]